jgi:hypothetical protein
MSEDDVANIPAFCPLCHAVIVRRVFGFWCPRCRGWLVRRLVPLYRPDHGDVSLGVWGISRPI